MSRFADKVVIVTGAGSLGNGVGNGKAAAVSYAREGASVVLVDRDSANLAETEALIRAEGGECTSIAVDVSLKEGVAAYVQHALSEYGGIDVLQNNVGIAPNSPTLEFSESRWDLAYRVNVKSLFLAVQMIVPQMRIRGGGSIVNISSVASKRFSGVPFAAYASSKAAANQLVKEFASEFAGDNIRCNSVVLGYIETSSVGVAYQGQGRDIDEMHRARAATVPLRRQGTPWDVAQASLFLASDDAQFVTGTEIVLDGGLSNFMPSGH